MPLDDIDTILENIRRNKNAQTFQSVKAKTGIDNTKLEKYVGAIAAYRVSKEGELNQLIYETTGKDKAKHVVLGGLFGAGIGGGAFALTAAETGNAPISAGFSTALALASSALMYEILEKNQEGAELPSLEEFRKALEESGFSGAEFTELSKNFIKLICYNDFLFMDEHVEAIKATALSSEEVDKELLNYAKQAYFMREMESLFKNAFQLIYSEQENKIRFASKLGKISNLFDSISKFFSGKDRRAQFAQQLQLKFMEDTIIAINRKMMEPGMLAAYPRASVAVAVIVGAMVGCLAIPFIGWAAIGVCALGAIALAAGVYFLKKKDFFKYKESKEVRKELGEMIADISKEVEYLKLQVKSIVPTSEKDLGTIQDILDAGIFLGSKQSWLREYSNRFSESSRTVVDLAEKIKSIGHQSEEQSKEVIESLGRGGDDFDQLVENTLNYLVESKNQEIIIKFELKEKIRQQILEIIATRPASEPLPPKLVNLYIAVDGFALRDTTGHKHDLYNVRHLAPTKDVGDLPYKELVACAQTLDNILRTADNGNILTGDPVYRGKLGLIQQFRNTTPIDINNIETCLDASYYFLHSLNMYKSTQKFHNGNEPITNSNEFILYRTLLIKQLATLADPLNRKVSEPVKIIIRRFAQEKLQVDPDVIFDDIRNQMIFDAESQNASLTASPVPNLEDLRFMAGAIRVDIAYASKPATPNFLLQQEMKRFLAKRPNTPVMFGYGFPLNPSNDPIYLGQINDSIEASKKFIRELEKNPKFVKSRLLEIYIEQTRANSIDDQLKLIKNFSSKGDDLAKAESSLQAFDRFLKDKYTEIQIANKSESQENPFDDQRTAACIQSLQKIITGETQLPVNTNSLSFFSDNKLLNQKEMDLLKAELAAIVRLLQKFNNLDDIVDDELTKVNWYMLDFFDNKSTACKPILKALGDLGLKDTSSFIDIRAELQEIITPTDIHTVGAAH